MEWPSIADIQAAQRGKVAPISHQLDDQDVYVDSCSRPWIPEKADDLLLRLMIVAHCGAQGHRGVNTMVQQLERFFDIPNVHIKARAFCADCLLCRHVKGGQHCP
ncbi:unnamed protein product [Phytophthora fragariaefolia]|uniref:Unnamed protein product n=1 Tax=Phytophthora fragariaefolia TaxID=1490495 RepID=A0A9W6YF57_9STRA|nr:unnamed protein product [Phytophthora fragariaefolia]